MEPVTTILITTRPIPDHALAAKILIQVNRIEQRKITYQLWIQRTLITASIIGLVPVTLQLGSQLSQSGFYQYISLIFSDGGSLITTLKDFGFILIESLPVMNLIVFCGILTILFWALRNTTRTLSSRLAPLTS
jgi:hypothetical protein